MAKKSGEDVGKEIGVVKGYLSHLSVAIVELSSALKKGEKIRIKGHTTNFEQTVDSMQIEHKQVEKAKKGDSIGMKVADRCRDNDRVYIVK